MLDDLEFDELMDLLEAVAELPLVDDAHVPDPATYPQVIT